MKTPKYLSSFLALAASAAFAASAVAAPTLNPANGHYYEFVFVPETISWPDAKAAAEQSSFNCGPGHLATLTSFDEDSFVEGLRVQFLQDNNLPNGFTFWAGGFQL